ncbi:MAG: hypothetical protein V8R50_06795 [Clostridia bacterium]
MDSWSVLDYIRDRGSSRTSEYQNEFKNRPWTLEYKKACGRCWLVLGIPCLVWGIICRVMEVSGSRRVTCLV